MSTTKAEQGQLLKTPDNTWVPSDVLFRDTPRRFKDDLRNSQERAIEDSIRRGLADAAEGRVAPHDELLDEE